MGLPKEAPLNVPYMNMHTQWQVGSGKSSLLAAMLGEIRKVSGELSLNGSLAYTSQVCKGDGAPTSVYVHL